MLLLVKSAPLVRYTLSYPPEFAMPITRIFRNGNSQAVRIPAKVAFPETQAEVEIKRIGDALHIHPVCHSLAGRSTASDASILSSWRKAVVNMNKLTGRNCEATLYA